MKKRKATFILFCISFECTENMKMTNHNNISIWYFFLCVSLIQVSRVPLGKKKKQNNEKVQNIWCNPFVQTKKE